MAKFIITKADGKTFTAKAKAGASQDGLVRTAKALLATGAKAVTITN